MAQTTVSSLVSRVSSRILLTATRTTARSYCQMCHHSAGAVTTVKRQLLPAHVKPVHYRVFMEPDLANLTYTGHVEIDVNVVDATKSVSVNSHDLKILAAKVFPQKGQETQVTNQSYDEDSQSLTLEVAEDLVVGTTATIRLDYEGILNDKMAGFYRSLYKDEAGKTWTVATTQMEPTDCRRAFPCFDEPSLKATFDITIAHEAHLTALSNMDVKEVKTLDNGKKVTSFNTTPVMSTYLVAFTVGEFKCVESNYFRVPVKVWATPGLEHKGTFSADLGARTLEFFEKRFGIEYPLPKMDMIAIHDFSAGAMENWGLVTYRVVDLLFDEKTDGAATKQRVAEVVQHELAHQWFGNLVTMDWWEGLWLNEGFATWMSWYSCNHFFPGWKVWETYVEDTLQSCLALDGLRSSHPVEVPVARADEINQIFDAISYSKGSCCVKMVANYLGEDVFIKGISNYLKKYAYSNTKTSDLWDVLSEVSGKDVASLMEVWTTKVGYPVVSVTENTDSTLTIKQNRFLTTGDVKPEDDTTVYPIALELRDGKSVDHTMMTTRDAQVQVNDMAFYKLNAQQAGLYRVLYPEARLEKLGSAGNSGLLTPEDKIGLVADTGALSVAGYQSTSALLKLVSQWNSETQANVWFEMLSRISSIRDVWQFEGEEFLNNYKKFMREFVAPKGKELGYVFAENDQDILTQQLKAQLFATAVSNESPEFMLAAKDMWTKYAAGDKDAIHPNLRASVFGLAAKQGDKATLDKLLDIYLNNKSSEGIAALGSLGKCKNAELRKEQLKHAFDDTVKPQDIFYLIVGFSSDAEGMRIRLDWFKENWDAIMEKFPPSLGMLSSVIKIVFNGLFTKEYLAEFEEFFAGKDLKGYDMAVAVVRDNLTSRINWIERDREPVLQWFAKQAAK